MRRKHHGVRDCSIREKAYYYIQQLIASGTLTAGGGISELSLAEELGSSRTPIREAMNQLASEGLLAKSPSGGMVVAQLTREDIIELFEVREALEVYAVGRIARIPMQMADLDRLRHFVEEIRILIDELELSKAARLDESQMERFISCDFGFHALLASMTRNSKLVKVISETRLLIRVFAIHRGGHDLEALRNIYNFHKRILDAVSKQDSEAATAVLAEHIQAALRERLNEYDAWKRQNALQGSMPVFFDIHKSISPLG